ncbi:hypothetical protein FH968_02070 [Buttiauxella sp. B2]|uniref:conserved phage C-terminal domain-containing protein n=1 Tax=Buttiauxella sp. B2 TaxID=2587812 RepID=UPI00111F8EB4|nr:conserved phage C-terminal domain-containing protein [Buttiauxella sp. B2]TNV22850.1 hypothetical protein FH968_02070 [Buttiauxella sp. B2]
MGALIQLLDRPIAYQPSFARLRAGNIKVGPVGAVLLSQFVYWHNRMDGKWLYKTQVEIARETGLSRAEQETARKRLVSIGVLEESLKGVPATMHYRIDSDRLEALLIELTEETRQIATTPQTRLRQPRKQVCGIPANKIAATPQTSMPGSPEQVCGDPANFPTGYYSENTQETTQRDCQADEQPDDFDDPALLVLSHLNRTTRSEFQEGKTTMGFITGLLEGEYVARELILVTDYLTDCWDGDPKMGQYLRPSTMFNLENFEGYLPLARKWETEGRPPRNVPDIDHEERDKAYRRFLGQSPDLIVKTVLEINVRKQASLSNAGQLSPEASRRVWNRIWADQSERIQQERV